MMTTLTVNIDNKKTEKAVKAVLEALGVDYSIGHDAGSGSLTKSEQAMYKRLKSSVEQIKLHQEGKIQLPTIEEVLAEIS